MAASDPLLDAFAIDEKNTHGFVIKGRSWEVQMEDDEDDSDGPKDLWIKSTYLSTKEDWVAEVHFDAKDQARVDNVTITLAPQDEGKSGIVYKFGDAVLEGEDEGNSDSTIDYLKPNEIFAYFKNAEPSGFRTGKQASIKFICKGGAVSLQLTHNEIARKRNPIVLPDICESFCLRVETKVSGSMNLSRPEERKKKPGRGRKPRNIAKKPQMGDSIPKERASPVLHASPRSRNESYSRPSGTPSYSLERKNVERSLKDECAQKYSATYDYLDSISNETTKLVTIEGGKGVGKSCLINSMMTVLQDPVGKKPPCALQKTGMFEDHVTTHTKLIDITGQIFDAKNIKVSHEHKNKISLLETPGWSNYPPEVKEGVCHGRVGDGINVKDLEYSLIDREGKKWDDKKSVGKKRLDKEFRVSDPRKQLRELADDGLPRRKHVPHVNILVLDLSVHIDIARSENTDHEGLLLDKNLCQYANYQDPFEDCHDDCPEPVVVFTHLGPALTSETISSSAPDFWFEKDGCYDWIQKTDEHPSIMSIRKACKRNRLNNVHFIENYEGTQPRTRSKDLAILELCQTIVKIVHEKAFQRENKSNPLTLTLKKTGAFTMGFKCEFRQAFEKVRVTIKNRNEGFEAFVRKQKFFTDKGKDKVFAEVIKGLLPSCSYEAFVEVLNQEVVIATGKERMSTQDMPPWSYRTDPENESKVQAFLASDVVKGIGNGKLQVQMEGNGFGNWQTIDGMSNQNNDHLFDIKELEEGYGFIECRTGSFSLRSRYIHTEEDKTVFQSEWGNSHPNKLETKEVSFEELIAKPPVFEVGSESIKVTFAGDCERKITTVVFQDDSGEGVTQDDGDDMYVNKEGNLQLLEDDVDDDWSPTFNNKTYITNLKPKQQYHWTIEVRKGTEKHMYTFGKRRFVKSKAVVMKNKVTNLQPAVPGLFRRDNEPLRVVCSDKCCVALKLKDTGKYYNTSSRKFDYRYDKLTGGEPDTVKNGYDISDCVNEFSEEKSILLQYRKGPKHFGPCSTAFKVQPRKSAYKKLFENLKAEQFSKILDQKIKNDDIDVTIHNFDKEYPDLVEQFSELIERKITMNRLKKLMNPLKVCIRHDGKELLHSVNGTLTKQGFLKTLRHVKQDGTPFLCLKDLFRKYKTVDVKIEDTEDEFRTMGNCEFIGQYFNFDRIHDEPVIEISMKQELPNKSDPTISIDKKHQEPQKSGEKIHVPSLPRPGSVNRLPKIPPSGPPKPEYKYGVNFVKISNLHHQHVTITDLQAGGATYNDKNLEFEDEEDDICHCEVNEEGYVILDLSQDSIRKNGQKMNLMIAGVLSNGNFSRPSRKKRFNLLTMPDTRSPKVSEIKKDQNGQFIQLDLEDCGDWQWQIQVLGIPNVSGYMTETRSDELKSAQYLLPKGTTAIQYQLPDNFTTGEFRLQVRQVMLFDEDHCDETDACEVQVKGPPKKSENPVLREYYVHRWTEQQRKDILEEQGLEDTEDWLLLPLEDWVNLLQKHNVKLGFQIRFKKAYKHNKEREAKGISAAPRSGMKSPSVDPGQSAGRSPSTPAPSRPSPNKDDETVRKLKRYCDLTRKILNKNFDDRDLQEYNNLRDTFISSFSKKDAMSLTESGEHDELRAAFESMEETHKWIAACTKDAFKDYDCDEAVKWLLIDPACTGNADLSRTFLRLNTDKDTITAFQTIVQHLFTGKTLNDWGENVLADDDAYNALENLYDGDGYDIQKNKINALVNRITSLPD